MDALSAVKAMQQLTYIRRTAEKETGTPEMQQSKKLAEQVLAAGNLMKSMASGSALAASTKAGDSSAAAIQQLTGSVIDALV
jgi:hypothetical protein